MVIYRVFAVTDKLEQKRAEASSSTQKPFLKFPFLIIFFIYCSPHLYIYEQEGKYKCFV